MGTNNRPGMSNAYASTGTKDGVAEDHKSKEAAKITPQPTNPG